MASRSWRFFEKIKTSRDFRTANRDYGPKTVHPDGKTIKKFKKFFILHFLSFGSYPKQFGMSKLHKICNGVCFLLFFFNFSFFS